MSDKFLNTGGSGANISNGTANVYAAVLGAVNLNASMPIKTNSTKQLVSEKLDIADVQNLSSELSLKPELTFTESDTHSTPAVGQVKIYAKLDGNMYKKNDQGVESGIGGGGGGSGDVVGPISSIDNSVAFFDGTTGKIIKENTDFKFITGATYGDQLKVPDIETDDHFSVNEELQKITNFTTATEGATPITTITGELDVKKIKSYAHNAEIEFDNNNLTMNADGNIDITSIGYTQITAGTTLAIGAQNVDINGWGVITGLGGENLQTTLTTTQTSFTQDQELITKKYVDDNNTNDPKTQNIVASGTNTTQTLFQKNVIFGTDPAEVNDANSIKALQSFNTVSAPETGGFSFTIPTSIIIKSVIFLADHWGSTDITKEWKLWTQDRELKATITLDKLTLANGYYYTILATPIVLTAGSYRCGIILDSGDKKHNYSGASTFFNDFFTTASGVFSSPDPAPTLDFPNGGSNTPSSAFIFDILNSFDNKGTTNLEQEAIIQSAKIGHNFPNYYFSGVGDGTNIYGNPTETGVVSYNTFSDYVNLGGGGVNIDGKLVWDNFLNLYQAGKTINFDIKFRMAPWNVDGGLILFDFGTYRFIYANYGASLISVFELQSNGATFHTVNAQIPYASNFSEVVLNVVFVVDTQTFTASVAGTQLFTFTDTTPRTPTQAQKDFFSISGGGHQNYSNELRIYDIKVYYPPSTNSVVEITPTTARCNNTFSTQSMTCDSKIECPDFRVPTTQGGIRGYADQRIVFDEVNNELEIRSEATSVGKIKLVATDRTEIDTNLYIAGSGSIQRPFTVLNPTYNNSLQVERQALGMGLLWKDNDITQSYISSQGQILNVVAGTDLNIGTGTTGKVIGLPFDLIFAATDEVSTITTTGQKIQLRVPQDFTTSKIKLSVNSAGGAGFSVVIKKNGVIVATIAQNNLLVSNTTSVETYNEDNTISLEIGNAGSGTAVGLKCYLIGKTT